MVARTREYMLYALFLHGASHQFLAVGRSETISLRFSFPDAHGSLPTIGDHRFRTGLASPLAGGDST